MATELRKIFIFLKDCEKERGGEGEERRKGGERKMKKEKTEKREH